jgi:hypothetical protein
MFGGAVSVAHPDSKLTLTSVEAAHEQLRITGALTSDRFVVFPDWRGQRPWLVTNATTGSGKHDLALQRVGGAPFMLAAGMSAFCWIDVNGDMQGH